MQEQISHYIRLINKFLWDPLIILFIITGILTTIFSRFIQFKYFFKSFKLILTPKKSSDKINKEDNLTPLQAFINALSTSIGNGSLAGMATAVHEGGPGAAFWIFVLGIFSMPIRFCEVYLSGAYTDPEGSITTKGPMTYLRHVPGGSILPGFYAFFCLLLSFVGGNAIQVNSISSGFQNLIANFAKSDFISHDMKSMILNGDKYIIAFALFAFVAYIMLGGSNRIIKFSMAITPIKVALFFISVICLLIYHMPALIETLRIIIISAFDPQAIKGAILGTTMMGAIRFGLSRSVNASESGLGIAAIFFADSSKKSPVESGIMSMVSTFISNYLVCAVLALLVVLTGVWQSDATSTVLMTQAFSTLYGSFANWLIAILSVIFGMSVLVGYAYIGKQCFSYLTKGKHMWVYSVIYVIIAFLGSIAKVQLIWDSLDLVNAGLMAINLYGILCLLSQVKIAVTNYMKNNI